MRTVLLLLVVVIYLPVSQAVAQMIVYQLRQPQLNEPLQPLHTTVAFVCLVAYVLAIPLVLFHQLRMHCSAPQPATSAEPTSPQTQTGETHEAVALLVGDDPNMESDFIAEGQQADELVRALVEL